jgi:rhodanese-related sulfurtransferase
MKTIIILSLLACAALFPFTCNSEAQTVDIVAGKPYAVVSHGAGLVKVERVRDVDPVANSDDSSSTDDAAGCPPFCVNPMQVANAVETVGELEVITFMESTYLSGDGVIVDLRSPQCFAHGTIPGSINIPSSTFEQPSNGNDLVQALYTLGASERGDVNPMMRALEKVGLFGGAQKTDDWDFSRSRDVLLWCDGPTCEESPRAIHALLSLGYPPEKLFYYRGGMRVWQSLGLTTVVPAAQSAFASK